MQDADRVMPDPDPVGTYAALAALLSSDRVRPEQVDALLQVAESRQDCADFRVLVLLALLLRDNPGGTLLSAADRARALQTVRGFRYWMSEPGSDGMCLWSENHQVLFATCEYLAGTLLADQRFDNDGRLGWEHAGEGRRRLQRWLRLRYRFGFSEWLSPVYYEENVAALSMLIDHAPDPELVTLATGILDLLLLDCALHLAGGVFSPAAGRSYQRQQQQPLTAEMHLVVEAAFGDRQLRPAWDQLAMLFLLRQRYQVPPVLREIAASTEPVTVRSSHGLDIREATAVFGDRLDPETTGALLWGMEAFVTADSIETTMASYRHWNLAGNPFLRGLAPLLKVPRILLRPLVRLLNPVVRGTALERAEVQTHRGRSFAISSAQHYRPGGFGDQQHLWQALLPGGIAVFATHPGAALVDDDSRNRTPDAWVGNGINPDIGQDGPLLLAHYDTRVRRGHGERERFRGSHLYLPRERLDRFLEGPDWLVVGAGDGLLGIRTTGPLIGGQDEYQLAGPVTGWLVVGAELSQQTPQQLRDWLLRCRLTSRGRWLQAETPRGSYRLGRGRLRRDGRNLPARYGRYESPWVTAGRDPARIVVVGEQGRLAVGPQGRQRWR